MLPRGEVSRSGLEPGVRIDPSMLDVLAAESQPSAARADTMRYLSGAEHTSSQLSAYLSGRGYSTAVVEIVAGWAEENGFVDDARFAAMFVSSHSGRSPMGSVRLKGELRRRGVPENVADSVLSQREDTELISTLVETVKRKYGGLPREVGFRRASGYLARRGFTSDLSYRVISRALNVDGEEAHG